MNKRVGSSIKISLSHENEDPHHCKCFKIIDDLATCKSKLEKLGFGLQIFEDNHGQVFGLTFRLNQYEQIHIKVMPDGTIEAEIEPPPAYPLEHLNQEYCYSAHQELEQILNHAGIRYIGRGSTPVTCIQRQIKKPAKPTHVVTIIFGVAIAVSFVYILASLAKGGRA